MMFKQFCYGNKLMKLDLVRGINHFILQPYIEEGAKRNT